MITSEIRWKQISYCDKEIPYIVSDNGIIISLHSPTKPKILKFDTDKDGYYKTYLSFGKIINGRSGRKFLVHRLVAMAFCTGWSNENNVVNHIDGNKNNNSYSNLEWVNQQENEMHASNNYLKANGMRNYLGKYTDEQVRQICILLLLGYTNNRISEMTKMPYSFIWEIRNGKIRHQILDEYLINDCNSLKFNDYRNWINFSALKVKLTQE